MLEVLVPDQYVASIFDIKLDALKVRGIDALIIDIDNTLVGWKTKTADTRLLEWFELLESKGFKVCLLSNNTKDRVVKFTQSIRIPAVYRAAKPGKRAFRKAMEIMDKTESQTAVIGDQIFTDIFGGNRIGLYTLLVMPINKNEFITTRYMRKLEKRMIKKMVSRGKLIEPNRDDSDE